SVHQESRPGRKGGAAVRAARQAGAAALHPVARAAQVTPVRPEASGHSAKSSAAEPVQLLERGRACFERHEWNEACHALALADASRAFGADDLQRLASSAGLTARDDEMLPVQERLYHTYLEAGEKLAAARAAVWLGFRLFARGEAGQAGGWLGRAQRLVER